MKVPFKRLRSALGEIVISFVQFFFTRTPLFLTRFISDSLFLILYPFLYRIPSLRRQLFGNLRIAFGDQLTKSETRRLCRSFLKSLFRMPGEILYYGHPKNHDKLKRDITISGREHLEEALKEGRGVIGLGSHMVDFMLLTVRLAQSDMPFIVPTKAPRNKFLKEKYSEWWSISGVKYIDVDDRERARDDILSSLKDNMLVYLIADERKKRDGISVPFFGKPALTAKGPAVLSLTTGAPIIPIYINHEDGCVIDILPRIEYEPTGDEKEDIYQITAKVNKSIEDYIRKYPDQWIWLNPRWKM
ncbi:MAG: lysophospholipid acyltransferase family protein [Deltaproteobacteria bacterium]|uniref:Lysophospholipid acyltransferase family protein n=1 Tax=Candidatus Zymogenus saltonus TaxID=2844893 RepID=A0A9D8PRJ3_9DELT|nr:lysophospholipid acyltransferase family protein [Candidatus Zymogenus saltonus]